jgi:hypothetical protein
MSALLLYMQPKPGRSAFHTFHGINLPHRGAMSNEKYVSYTSSKSIQALIDGEHRIISHAGNRYYREKATVANDTDEIRWFVNGYTDGDTRLSGGGVTDVSDHACRGAKSSIHAGDG